MVGVFLIVMEITGERVTDADTVDVFESVKEREILGEPVLVLDDVIERLMVDD